MIHSTLSDLEVDSLVLQSQDGDKDAFAKLYDNFFDAIYRYVFFRVPEKEVDDLVGNVFIKAWVNMEKYEKRDVRFAAWLYRIAHNSIIDYRRSHRPLFEMKEDIKDESERSAPDLVAEKKEASEAVRNAVEQLKEPYRQVITFKFLLGLSNTEVAEILNEREGNIRVLQFRALKELKSLLDEKGLKAEFL